METLRQRRNARHVGHEGRPPRRQILRRIRKALQSANQGAHGTGAERGGGEKERPRDARGAGDAAQVGGPRSRGLLALGNHERLGVRGLRRDLQGAGRRFRQGLLRIADLPAGQEPRRGGAPQGCFLPPSRQFGLDRPHGRRTGRETAAARRRHVGLHDAGPRHGFPPLRGQ